MAVRIGSARIDENGKAHGGAAGDQTGKEVSTQEWYKQTNTAKTWRVFRPKDPDKAEKIARAMQAACDNPNIGYDQYERNSLYNAVKYVGFDTSKVASKVETDCSALVRVCCAYAGITLANFTTPGEPDILLGSGEFIELIGDKYSKQSDYLKRGDILCTKSQGHTVVVLTDGPKCEQGVDPVPTSTKYNVRVLDGNWYVRTEPNKNAKALGVAKKGEEYPFVEENEGGSWDKIVYRNQIAYISVRACEIVPAPKTQFIEVKGTWYVRTEANKNSESIGSVKTGDKVKYLGFTKDGWYGIEYKGLGVWVSAKSGKIVD